MTRHPYGRTAVPIAPAATTFLCCPYPLLLHFRPAFPCPWRVLLIMLLHAAVVLGVVLMPQMANAQSYLADLPCFCGTVPRASDELEYFMNSPVEALDFTVPMFELGLMANTTEGLRHWFVRFRPPLRGLDAGGLTRT
eukprot:COSAG01_NODE_672_length_14331_cov_88.368092_4_plen_138_part_00